MECGEAMVELSNEISSIVSEAVKAVTTEKKKFVQPRQHVKVRGKEFTDIEKMLVLIQYILTRHSIKTDLKSRGARKMLKRLSGVSLKVEVAKGMGEAKVSLARGAHKDKSDSEYIAWLANIKNKLQQHKVVWQLTPRLPPLSN